MRKIIEKTKARFTHPGAEEIYTVHKDRMDTYAERWGRLADKIWKEEYQMKFDTLLDSSINSSAL